MAKIAVFHSVLGVRAGVLDAAKRLKDAGHEVLVVDQYDGRVFDDYEEAAEYSNSIGFPLLMKKAGQAVKHLPDGFVVLGFSNGAGMAEYVTTRRPVSGAVLIAGVLPVDELGAEPWPRGVPAQLHCTDGDRMRRHDWLHRFVIEAYDAHAGVEVFDYPGSGHLFTDPSLPDEYDAAATEQVWERAIDFVGRVSS